MRKLCCIFMIAGCSLSASVDRSQAYGRIAEAMDLDESLADHGLLDTVVLYDGYHVRIVNDRNNMEFAGLDLFRLVKLDTDVVKFRYNPSKLKKYDRFECEDTNDVRCAGVKDGMLRLYKEFYLPSECLKGIIIHAFDDNFQIQKKHLEIWLRQNGFDIDPGFIKETSSYPVRK